MVDGLTVNLFPGVDLLSHAGALCPLTGEQENQWPGLGRDHSPGLWGPVVEVLRFESILVDGDERAILHLLTPVLKGVGDVGGMKVGIRLETDREVRRPLRKGCFGPGRQHIEMLAPGRGRHRRRLMLFQHHMNVRSTEAERRYAGTPRLWALGPIQGLGIEIKWARREIDAGIVLGEVGQRRQGGIFKCQTGLYHADDACGGAQVADIGFDRSDGAITGIS